LIDLLRAEQNPRIPDCTLFIANVHYKRKDYDALLKYTASVKEKEGLSNRRNRLLSAEAQFKKSDYKSALAGYQQYLNGKNNADAEFCSVQDTRPFPLDRIMPHWSILNLRIRQRFSGILFILLSRITLSETTTKAIGAHGL